MSKVQEIDLHTRSFIRNTSGLNAEDLVQLSIERMHAALKKAIQNKQKQIKFIHGIGQGTLRARVYEELRICEAKGLIASFEPSFFNEGVVIVNISYA
ncbi:MAG TPA: Smr/MutS family protein [Sphingobacterium sp.]|nr:Smr/MutS family protein [Sphingobacterium sp.]